MRSQYVVKCVKNARARRGKVWVARQHPVVALRQRPAERIPGLAAHEYRVASGDALELLHVVGQTPWQAVGAADQAVLVHPTTQTQTAHALPCDRPAGLARALWRAPAAKVNGDWKEKTSNSQTKLHT